MGARGQSDVGPGAASGASGGMKNTGRGESECDGRCEKGRR
jgi:hypothetical protein